MDPRYDQWAKNSRAYAGGAAGAAIYCPSSGAVLSKDGSFDCSGNLHVMDQKAAGKEVSAPDINGQKFMFVTKAGEDDLPIYVFKKGQNSLLTLKGPENKRIAVYVEGGKAEPAVEGLTKSLKGHV